ncbi:MAG: tRNA (adenosine(37)-N6)-threonylcarbamoyltransferase complex ATPase subunit type 1 TsaE [Candidatus Dormibacteraeota bacterium]|nr:tRNA (adenosine(37)-N6)-threonylcarbamoyltransferase complex ATPase subunit type 1 TsaE [Candidatus Dormibacteraeota bacterium]
MVIELHSDSPQTTEHYGAALGAALRTGDVLVLEGPLGAGKTCLVRGVVVGAGGEAAAVRSPTFVLHQPHHGTTITVHHIDLFRLGPGASVDVLDLDTLLAAGAVVIEWGAYADLRHLRPTTVTIAGTALPHNERMLRMEQDSAAHLERAWAALRDRTGAP